MTNLQNQMVILLLVGPPFLVACRPFSMASVFWCLWVSVSWKNNLIDLLTINFHQLDPLKRVMFCHVLPTLSSMPSCPFALSTQWNPGLVTALPYICIATGLHDLLAPWYLGSISTLWKGRNTSTSIFKENGVQTCKKCVNGYIYIYHIYHIYHIWSALGRWLHAIPMWWHRCRMVHFGSGQHE